MYGQIFIHCNFQRIDLGESGHVSHDRIVQASWFSRKCEEVSASSVGCSRALNGLTVHSIRRRNSVVPFDVGQVFLFFLRLLYFLMCYRSVLYLLNCKALFCLDTVVLLGCCEFNLNVMCARINVCSRITVPHATGA